MAKKAEKTIEEMQLIVSLPGVSTNSEQKEREDGTRTLQAKAQTQPSTARNTEQTTAEGEEQVTATVTVSGEPAKAAPVGEGAKYYVDPNVIKRIQWRLSRMEDFESSIGAAIQEIKESIAKLETTRLELEEMRRGYATVERTMHELAALYDLISSSINPFIDAVEEQKTISDKILKKSLGLAPEVTTTFVEPKSVSLTAMPKEEYSPDTWTVKWAEFLLERIPKSKIPALLDHYIEIGWLDLDVKSKLENCIKGISEINLGIKAPSVEEGVEGEDKKKLDWWKLPIDDHVKSLQFIEKIRGMKIDEVSKEALEAKRKGLGEGSGA